jgi:signal transduction histidine kinase
MKTPQLTIRMTLLVIVAGLNFLIAVLVGHRVYKSWQHYQQAESLKSGAAVINSLYVANQNLSQARAATLSIMYLAPEIAEPIRQDMIKSREASNTALDAAIEAMQSQNAADVNTAALKMQRKYKQLLKRRDEVDIELMKPVAMRNQAATNKFYEENTGLIDEIQSFILIYSRAYQGLDYAVSQHVIFEYFVWELAEYSGEEYAIIGQLLAENKYPSRAQNEQLISLRERIEYGWGILRKFSLNEELAGQLFPLMEEAKTQYFFTFDQVRDLFYQNYTFETEASYPIDSELWLGISAQAVDSLLMLQNAILSDTQRRVNRIENDAKREIFFSALIFLSAVLISIYCWMIIAFRVAKPVNLLVNALYKATQENIFDIPKVAYPYSEIGKLLSVLEVFQRNAAKMKQSNDELERFAFIAAHDLKSPLRAVDNLSLWLEEDLGEQLPEASKKHMEELRKRVRLMDKMLDDTLEYARIDSKIDSHINVVVSGKVLMEEIFELLAVPERFTLKIGASLAHLHVQKLPLQQVLFNLVNNAIKHHDKARGTIEVDGIEKAAEFVFSVRDDGPGIDPQYHKKIFEMFQTLQPRDKNKGRGMGLAMVRKIITANGGVIKVESTLGQGSLFQFTWPK